MALSPMMSKRAASNNKISELNSENKSGGTPVIELATFLLLFLAISLGILKGVRDLSVNFLFFKFWKALLKLLISLLGDTEIDKLLFLIM